MSQFLSADTDITRIVLAVQTVNSMLACARVGALFVLLLLYV